MEQAPKLHPVFPIVMVDDEIYALQMYEMYLNREGLTHLRACQNGPEALAALAAHTVSALILDLYMPGMSGEEVLVVAAAKYPEVPVIITTAMDEVATIVRCMKAGAFDYIVKPIDPARLITTVKRALEFGELRRENVLLKASVLDNTLKQPEAFAAIITNHPAMRALFKYIESIALTSQPVLITGETGVGKESIAQAIHRLSGRKGPLVAVNVAGLDETTFADTLFGHKRGAFTSADRAREGLIERAANGTLFLDEIGDLSPTSQVKLLRLLQEREYYPLGADVPRVANARIVVATNRDLAALQAADQFRTDLYYRLLAHRIHVPPLRERREDLPLLTAFFLHSAAQELQKAAPAAPPELCALLAGYAFPGNIRELKALLFDAVSREDSGTLSLRSLQDLLRSVPPTAPASLCRAAATPETLYASLKRLPTLAEAETWLIQEALQRTAGNQTLAAALLGTTRQTLHRRLQTKN